MVERAESGIGRGRMGCRWSGVGVDGGAGNCFAQGGKFRGRYTPQWAVAFSRLPLNGRQGSC